MDIYLVKSKHIFSKVHFILKKTCFILKFCKHVLINELYKNKSFNGKSLLESMHYCYLTTKNTLGLKKKKREMEFQIRKFMLFLVHLTMHLLGREYT
jgi:hypothetical protein